MTAPADVYQVASGLPIYGGKAPPSYVAAFDSVALVSDDGGLSNGLLPAVPVPVIELHGSGGQNLPPGGNGTQWLAQVSGLMAYSQYTTFNYSTALGYNGAGLYYAKYRPQDYYPLASGGFAQSSHHGFVGLGTSDFTSITMRRIQAMLAWGKTDATMSKANYNKLVVTGGSMGAWGTMTIGLRSGVRFAAMYADRPRWRYGKNVGNIPVPSLAGDTDTPVSSSPNMRTEDGGGTLAARLDHVAYVGNTANVVPWIGWCVGSDDSYTAFSDHVAAVAALRAAKRGFAFAWNTGDHEHGSILDQVTTSYPFGTFEIGKGYPLFTSHSLDNDPAVDPVGGINVGLSFRNVVESSAGWSCEITNINAACTVAVEPKSDVFTSAGAKKTVTIPAANTWVPVQFP